MRKIKTLNLNTFNRHDTGLYFAFFGEKVEVRGKVRTVADSFAYIIADELQEDAYNGVHHAHKIRDWYSTNTWDAYSDMAILDRRLMHKLRAGKVAGEHRVCKGGFVPLHNPSTEFAVCDFAERGTGFWIVQKEDMPRLRDWDFIGTPRERDITLIKEALGKGQATLA